MRVTDVAERLHIAPSTASQTCSALRSRLLLSSEAKETPGKDRMLSITDRGERRIINCETAIESGLDDLLTCLTPELRGILDGGILATAISIGRADYTVHGFNLNSAYAECNSRFESIVDKLTHSSNLALNEYRVLLLVGEQQTGLHPTDLSRILLLPKPTVTYVVKKLLGMKLIDRVKDRVDKRASLLFTNEAGERVLAHITPQLEDFFAYGLKNTDSIERTMYGRMASRIVVHRREQLTSGACS